MTVVYDYIAYQRANSLRKSAISGMINKDIYTDKYIKYDSSTYEVPSTAYFINESLSRSDLIFCVTLYNEDVDYLLTTLISLSQSLNLYCGLTSKSVTTTICIIADGADRLSPSVRALLLEYLGNQTIEKLNLADPEHGAHIFSLAIDLEKIRKNRHIDLGNARARQENIEFCVKIANKGKLDSHKWFFRDRCPSHDPEYCFQIDAGTTITPQALTSMIESLERDGKVSAVASNVYIESNNKSDLLESFQCGDFVVQRSVHWPAELASGYLSVVPGQFCGMRWRSLIRGVRQGHDSVLGRYLSGTNCKSAAEKIMFMAEDRVISLELITEKGVDNRVDFAIGSDCYTDACGTMEELLKQRRRWINSTFVCRGWMMKRLARHLFDDDPQPSRIARTAASFASMSWYHAMEFFQPLISFLFLFVTYRSISSVATHFGMATSVAIGGFLALAVAWLMPTVMALCNGFKGVSRRRERFVLWGAAASVAGCTGLNATSALITGDGISLPLVAPLVSALIVLAASTLASKRLSSVGRATLLQYNLVCVPMLLALYSYAFCNMSDTSWGTKGLDKENCGYSGQQGSLNRAVDAFSAKFVALWIVANIGAACAAMYLSAAPIVLSAIATSLILYFMLGLFGTIQLALKKKKRAFSCASDVLPVSAPAM